MKGTIIFKNNKPPLASLHSYFELALNPLNKLFETAQFSGKTLGGIKVQS